MNGNLEWIGPIFFLLCRTKRLISYLDHSLYLVLSILCIFKGVAYIMEVTQGQKEEVDTPKEGGIVEEMARRDLYKLYVSNLGNFMSQKEATKFFSSHQIEGIK